MCTLICEGFGVFFNSVELTFISWWRRFFLTGKILINTHISWDPFLVEIPLIRISHGIQDISLYRCSWALSKAALDPSTYSPRWSIASSKGFPLGFMETTIEYRGVVSFLVSSLRIFICLREVDGSKGTVSFLVSCCEQEHPYHDLITFTLS